jgi:hypothetical protein
MCRLQLHDWRIRQVRNQKLAVFLYGLLFVSGDGSDMFLRNVRLTFNELHGVISQKTELLKFLIGQVIMKVPYLGACLIHIIIRNYFGV